MSIKFMSRNVYGASKLAFHKDKVISLSRKEITAPIYVRVKPTNKCNHKCFFCGCSPNLKYFRNETINKSDEIPYETMINLISDFKDMNIKAVTYSGGGEPLIYPHITRTLERTLMYNIELSMITNGQELMGEKAELLTNAEWVRVSIDGIDAETLYKSRRVGEKSFNIITENLREFSKKKKEECVLGINFPVHHINKDQVYRAAEFFREMGANNIKFTPTWMPNFSEYHNSFREKVIEQIERAISDFSDRGFEIYDTYENDFKLSGVNKRTYSRCCIMEIVPAIGADSFIYFCQDKAYSRKDSIGSLKGKSFKELWFSEETARIFQNFNPKERCKHHCTYDQRNITINKMIETPNGLEEFEPNTNKHKNFI